MTGGRPVLVGQYDSPFVRRVAVTLQVYGMPFDRRVLSVFGDADAVAGVNPLIKVPTLVLADGEHLFDSAAILDYLDEQAGADKALMPARGADRRAVLRFATIAMGLAEKSVSRSIDRKHHGTGGDNPWRDRLDRQIGLSLTWLEDALPNDGWFLGSARFSQADISMTAALGHLHLRHPDLLDQAAVPKLTALRARAEDLACFKAVPLIEG